MLAIDLRHDQVVIVEAVVECVSDSTAEDADQEYTPQQEERADGMASEIVPACGVDQQNDRRRAT